MCLYSLCTALGDAYYKYPFYHCRRPHYKCVYLCITIVSTYDKLFPACNSCTCLHCTFSEKCNAYLYVGSDLLYHQAYRMSVLAWLKTFLTCRDSE